MSDPTICPLCGGKKKPEFELCGGCAQKQKSIGAGKRAAGFPAGTVKPIAAKPGGGMGGHYGGGRGWDGGRQGGGGGSRGRDDRGQGGGPRGGGGGGPLPEDILFTDSFYNADGCLCRRIFIEAAETAAHLFEHDKMSQSSIRSLFQRVKDMDQRIKADRKDQPEIDLCEVQQCYYEFIRQCVYQNKRRIIPDSFLQFAEKHTDVATGCKEEFHGFVEYLTSIMARMKTKG